MQNENFRMWLMRYAGIAENAINSRISNCKRVESAFGDLDEQFDLDQLSSVLKSLSYSKDDKRNNVPQPGELNISGDIYDGLATLRQALRKYIDFREEQEHIPTADSQDSDILHESTAPISGNLSDVHLVAADVSDNTILLLPIKDLGGLTFTIGRYQRGYKWGKKEIIELLNDIRDYKATDGIYCLQPIILKPLFPLENKLVTAADKVYSIYGASEIIDGQQRTTTLFLLISFLKHIGHLNDFTGYAINFQTRTGSGLFLAEQLGRLLEYDVSSIPDSELNKRDYRDLRAVNKLWATFVNDNTEYDNVDIYHFFIVMAYIKKWAGAFLVNNEDIQVFCRKLMNSVNVIWCSLDSAVSNNNVIDVFLNNNKGKIDLTSSELIKALFILHIGNSYTEEIASLNINRFSNEWDTIEKKLQDEKFWFFVQKKAKSYNNGTRIDYLFDLRLGRGKGDDDLFAYRIYEAHYNNKNFAFSEEWTEILRLFRKLVDWYDDSEFYHYIGYIIHSDISSLRNVLKISKGETKPGLKDKLKGMIRNHFRDAKYKVGDTEFQVYALDNLHYEDFKMQTRKVLLLHNLLYYIENMAGHKFPFQLFVKQDWSIEHIVPQTPKEFDDFGMYKAWFTEQIEFQGMPAGAEETIQGLTAKNSMEELKANKSLLSRVEELIRGFEDTTHQIGNLLLLDRNTNSALQNKFFPEKRKKLLELDRDGKFENEQVFIPIETLNAFNKTFSLKMEYKHWTRDDAEHYRDAVAKRLEYFLPKNRIKENKND